MIAVLKDGNLETDCGDEAVQIFIDRYEDINLVLLDMQMPDKNGAEVLSFIDANVKAFFVSGVVVDWESLGAIGILQKPFQAKDLAKAVRDSDVKHSAQPYFPLHISFILKKPHDELIFRTTIEEAQLKLQSGNALFVDIRDYASHCGGHIEPSFHLDPEQHRRADCPNPQRSTACRLLLSRS